MQEQKGIIFRNVFNPSDAGPAINRLNICRAFLPRGAESKRNSIANLVAFAESRLSKPMTREEGLLLIKSLEKTVDFLENTLADDDNYENIILEVSQGLDPFPWFKVLMGILLTILALALLATAAALVVSLTVTTGPVAAIVAPVVLLFEKIIAFTAALNIAELTFGVVAAGTVGTTAATGVIAGVNVLGAALSGFVGGFFMKNPSFKGYMEDIVRNEQKVDNKESVTASSNSSI